MSLTELPYGLPGRIFRSPMPFRPRDEQGDIFRAYRQQGVSAVVVLAEDEEILNRIGLDLRRFYREQGLQVIHCPVPDFGVTSREAIDQAVEAALDLARAGRNLAVHCYAGQGRTGMFAACLAKRVLGLSGEEAVKWVRSAVPRSIENREQRQFVLDY